MSVRRLLHWQRKLPRWHVLHVPSEELVKRTLYWPPAQQVLGVHTRSVVSVGARSSNSHSVHSGLMGVHVRSLVWVSISLSYSVTKHSVSGEHWRSDVVVGWLLW